MISIPTLVNCGVSDLDSAHQYYSTLVFTVSEHRDSVSSLRSMCIAS